LGFEGLEGMEGLLWLVGLEVEVVAEDIEVSVDLVPL
jgi:hypothetical protein